MEAHLASCPDCRTQLEGYQQISEFLNRPGMDDGLITVQSRVWQNIMADKAEFPYIHELSFPVPRGKRKWPLKEHIWNRSVSIPLPAAAGAAALIIGLFVSILGGRIQENMVQDSAVTAGIGLDIQSTIPLSSIQGVLQYLEDQDNADFVILHLPESRSFSSAGEPAIIKAADYSSIRRSSSR
jgi:anti-sigma factor RsiW